MKKAKQSLKNTSAQIANANATFTVEPTTQPVLGTSRPAPQAGGNQPQAPDGTGEPGDQEDAASRATPLELALPPIYLALAISINLAADYQNDNGNVVKRK